MTAVNTADVALGIARGLSATKALIALEKGAVPLIEGTAGIAAKPLPKNAETALRVLARESVVYSDRAAADLVDGMETLCNRGFALKQKYGEIVSYHPLSALEVSKDPGGWWEWNQSGACRGRGVRNV